MSTTDIEKKSLEAHVELCAERYKSLDDKLDNLENRMDKIEGHIVDIKSAIQASNDSGNKQIITIGLSIFGVVLTGLIAFIIHHNS
jgi:predicted  nucleic acid-binding Zn-ribbon protein